MNPLTLILKVVVVCTVIFCSTARSQSLSLSVTPASQCYSSSNNSVTAYVAVTPSTATNYTWSVSGPFSCTATFTNSVMNGSVIAVTFPCCGTYTLACTAMSGTTAISGNTTNAVLSCPPVINVAGNTTLCSGSSASLIASGAQTYTWSNGFTSNVISVSPTVTTTYSVSGTSLSGCTAAGYHTVNIMSSAVANFSHTSNPNGQVVFNNTSANTTSNTSYFWNFGNGQTSTLVSPSVTYTNNGTYIVNLAANSSCGTSVYTSTITVTSVPVSSCVASFSYLAGTNGSYSFASTSSGTSSVTNYSWNFGNGSPGYTATGSAGINPPAQTYTSGSYPVVLIISSTAPLCNNTATVNINVCTVHADFSYLQTGLSTINFTNTSSGTMSGSTYTWNYGDGTSGNMFNSPHTYTAPGSYIVTLTANNTSSCASAITKTVVVSSCNLTSNFTHTALSNGVVHYNSSIAITNSSTKYYWNFGDGIYSLATSPTHTYMNAGTYLVTLKLKDSTLVSCFDSLTQSINVTGVPCTANANFSIAPTFSPQYYTATPLYPYNITAATWYWGDGTQDTVLYASHLYSVAANYSICLSVTVSCGPSSYTCFTNYLNKSENDPLEIISINVLRPEMSTGIKRTNQLNQLFEVFPNPSNGEFTVVLPPGVKTAFLTLYNLVGEVVHAEELSISDNNKVKPVRVNGLANGIYLLKLRDGPDTFTRKIVISN